jgi:hypothetical protein
MTHDPILAGEVELREAMLANNVSALDRLIDHALAREPLAGRDMSRVDGTRDNGRCDRGSVQSHRRGRADLSHPSSRRFLSPPGEARRAAFENRRLPFSHVAC